MDANGITLTNIGEFRATMREYREVSKRDDASILNTKGLYIALGALGITHRADPNLIQIELEALTQTRSTNKNGGLGRKQNINVKRYNARGQQYDVPLVALLINSQRAKKGQKGLYGDDMKSAVKGFIGSRKRSAAFIASGWLPAVKVFAPLAERIGSKPRQDYTPRQYGQAKGSGTAAQTSDYVPTAILSNFANAKGPTGSKALEKYATAALQTAFNDEMRSMKEYIERKKQETANRFNAR